MLSPDHLKSRGSAPAWVPFDNVQRWLLATDRDRIAVGLSFESPSICDLNIIRYRIAGNFRMDLIFVQELNDEN